MAKFPSFQEEFTKIDTNSQQQKFDERLGNAY
jgi:hypothetical protein